MAKVVLLYTRFTSMMTQTPVCEVLLPAEMPEGKEVRLSDVLTDESPEEMIASLFPQYVGGRVFAAFCECVMTATAMNAANKNASEMIDSLMLRYNRARQAVITQEITEIVSGAEAL